MWSYCIMGACKRTLCNSKVLQLIAAQILIYFGRYLHIFIVSFTNSPAKEDKLPPRSYCKINEVQVSEKHGSILCNLIEGLRTSNTPCLVLEQDVQYKEMQRFRYFALWSGLFFIRLRYSWGWFGFFHSRDTKRHSFYSSAVPLTNCESLAQVRGVLKLSIKIHISSCSVI